MDRQEALQLLLSHRMVAVLRLDDADQALGAGRAVLAGGARLVEVTATVPDFLAVLAELRREAPPGAAVGAGTVLTVAELDQALAAGADFAISPDVHPEVIAAARHRGVLHVPGAMTPGEVTSALRAGAEVVKLFPIASLGGAEHVRALRGPLPRVPFLVTGGVDLDSLAEFFAAGASAVGLSATLVVTELVRAGKYERISDLTRLYLERLGRLA